MSVLGNGADSFAILLGRGAGFRSDGAARGCGGDSAAADWLLVDNDPRNGESAVLCSSVDKENSLGVGWTTIFISCSYEFILIAVIVFELFGKIGVEFVI